MVDVGESNSCSIEIDIPDIGLDRQIKAYSSMLTTILGSPAGGFHHVTL